MARPRTCWLVKSEPSCFSIDDLAASPAATTCWSGVRNYQARNFMRDGMKLGDEALFYHSSAEPPAIVGRAIVVREAYPDPTAWDESDEHFDPKASPDNPIWRMVDIRFVEKFAQPLSLDALRGVTALKDMELLKRGSRLSVQPVSAKEFDAIVRLAAKTPAQRPTVPPAAEQSPAAQSAPTERAAAKHSAAKRSAAGKKASDRSSARR